MVVLRCDEVFELSLYDCCRLPPWLIGVSGNAPGRSSCGVLPSPEAAIVTTRCANLNSGFEKEGDDVELKG